MNSGQLQIPFAFLLAASVLLPRVAERCCEETVRVADDGKIAECCVSCDLPLIAADTPSAISATADDSTSGSPDAPAPAPERCTHCTANCCAKVVMGLSPKAGSAQPVACCGILHVGQITSNDRSLADVFHPPRA
ncbi:MAG: hypothetical protein HBSAPP02_29080 [Phycisphaerae bacterium]|nr:MAG: hypothetical protein HRU71_02055 [Planctomycetia bacterium]GJQ27876.1 MAG: hypothetical protein HBSAPP02_29080 [Phycisphaerae bacterium]